MDQIGLIGINFLKQLNREWETNLRLEASHERHALIKSQNNTLSLLSEIANANNIQLILLFERLLLNQELSLYANSPEEINSIKTALVQLDEAEESLLIVQKIDIYKQSSQTYSSKRKEKGLPLDSYRDFLKSHSSRLSNRLAGRLTPIEKDILRQRKTNLAVA
jgi:hypothetical protein